MGSKVGAVGGDEQLAPGNGGHKLLAPGTLWMIETVPGTVHAEDITSELLKKKLFFSVNRPYFPEVREQTGFLVAEQKHDAATASASSPTELSGFYSFDRNPRAIIFEGASVGSLLDLRGLMTENRYGVWPGPSSPGLDVSARFDLAREGATPNGGIDAKLVGGGRDLTRNW